MPMVGERPSSSATVARSVRVKALDAAEEPEAAGHVGDGLGQRDRLHLRGEAQEDVDCAQEGLVLGLTVGREDDEVLRRGLGLPQGHVAVQADALCGGGDVQQPRGRPTKGDDERREGQLGMAVEDDLRGESVESEVDDVSGSHGARLLVRRIHVRL